MSSLDAMDDAWSYSYPSSLDSLPLPDSTSITNQDVIASESTGQDENQKPNAKESVVTEQPKGIKLESPIALRRDSILQENNKSTDNSTSKPIPVPQAALLPKHKNSSNLSQSNATKSAPADPHTTKHDAAAFPGSNSSTSSLNDPALDLAMIQNQSPPSTPTQNGNFFNNMFSTMSFSKKGQNGKPSEVDSHGVDENGNVVVAMGSHSRTNSNGNSVKESPSMMSYRRKSKSRRRNTSASSMESLKSPLVEGEKPTLPTQKEESTDDTYDKNLYANEKFKDTNYRYSTDNRNANFHKLFKSIPEDERLLDDFSCALSREILLQGRLYVSERNICFNSNLLGWVTNLVVPYSDIRNFEKTATAGLFPNGIAIQLTNGHKHYFASFLSRDSTYSLLSDIRDASDDQVSNLANVNTNSFKSTSIKDNTEAKELSLDLEKYDKDEYRNALLSIDGDTPAVKKISDSDYTSDEDDENGSSSGSSIGAVSESGKIISSSQQIVYKLKDTSVYAYNGLEGHQETVSGYDFTANKETILAEESFNCPPGLLFEILFGPNNDLTLQFLGAQGSSEFSKFSDYEKNEQGVKQRDYNYIKALNFSIGPKSTKCFVEERIEKLDYNSHINVLSITKTPDVPSGKAFTVQTRYVMTWGPENTTNLVVAFKVDWTGSSWVKGMIDSSCASGQEEATKVLIPMLKKTVDENVFEAKEQVTVEDDIEPLAAAKLHKVDTDAKSVHIEPSGSSLSIPNLSEITWIQFTFLGLLLAILVFQIGIFKSLGKIPEKTFSFGLLDGFDRSTENAIARGEEILLWNWIDERAGKLDLSKSEKIGVIKNDIDQLVNKWVQKETKSKETRELVKSFEAHLNAYTKDTIKNGNEKRDKEKATALKAAIKALL